MATHEKRDSKVRDIRADPVLVGLCHTLLFLVTILGIFVMLLFGERMEQPGFIGHYGLFGVGQILLGLLSIFLMKKSGVSKTGDFTCTGFGKGMLLGWGGLLIAASSWMICLIPIPSEYYLAPHIFSLFVVVFHVFATGYFEETLVSELVLNVLLRKTGNSKNESSGHSSSLRVQTINDERILYPVTKEQRSIFNDFSLGIPS